MRIRLLVIALVLLSGGILLTCSCSGGGRRFVDKAVDYLQWSKNSQTLFYSKSQNKLFRWDVKTGKKQTFDVPDRLVEFDVSPDGQAIVFPMIRNKTYGLYVTELRTKKTRRTFVMENAIREYTYGDSRKPKKSLEFLKRIIDISWLPQNDFLLVLDVGKGLKDVCILNRRQNSLETIKRGIAYYNGVSIDGSSFLYEDLAGRVHLYNLKAKTDKRLDFGPKMTNTASVHFLYLSKNQIVFTYDKPKWIARTLNLTTMKVQPVDLPEVENISYISGDLSRALSGSSAHPSALHGGWVSNSVYVIDLPKHTIEQLRRLEQKSLPRGK